MKQMQKIFPAKHCTIATSQDRGTGAGSITWIASGLREHVFADA